MMNPDVTAVMPVYNGAEFLCDALDGVFAQTVHPKEIIVVDDASSDNSVSLLKDRYGGRITLIQREKNSGICEVARTQGVEAACTEYVCFIDQDDLWYPKKIELQYPAMVRNPCMPLAHTYMEIIDENNKTMGIRNAGRIPPSGFCAKELLRHCFITISSIMVRRNVWLAAGNVESLEDAHSDLDYFFSMLKSFPHGFCFVPEVLGAYRKWTGNMSIGDWRRTPHDLVAIERLRKNKTWQGVLHQKEFMHERNQVCLDNAAFWRQQGVSDRGLYFAFQALRANPLMISAWNEMLNCGGRRLFQGTKRIRK